MQILIDVRKSCPFYRPAGNAIAGQQASTAFDHRDAEYNLAIIARWPDPAGADGGIAWTRRLWVEMTPHAIITIVV